MTSTLPHKQLHDDQGMRDTPLATVVVEPQAASNDHALSDAQGGGVVAGPKPPADQGYSDPHGTNVGGALTPTTSQRVVDAQSVSAGGGSQTPEPSTASPLPKVDAAVQVSNSAAAQRPADTQAQPVGGAPTPQGSANGCALTNEKPLDLADPLLALAADVVDDLERVRVANENRLRQLTRNEEDKDGEERGFGLTLDHPDVARLSALVDVLKDAEKQATSNLTYRMKKHPLGPWVKQAKGIGEKQAARLLAAVGDPYWNDLYERPRLVSELWSYCGYGDSSRQVRRKGVKANWSDDAKKRAHLVAEKCKMQLSKPCYSVKGDDGLVAHTVHIDGECTCSPYRRLYDEKKAHYASSVHNRECQRCTGKGQPPAPVGSARKAAHIDAMALRAVKKEILRDMWREAKRLHELPGGHCHGDSQSASAAGVPSTPAVRMCVDTQRLDDSGGT